MLLKHAAHTHAFAFTFADSHSQGLNNKYYEGTSRFNLHAFWADHKMKLPLHYRVYIVEVGCKKAAAANCETVFSGAGKFSKEALSVSPKLMERMCKLHYNWKYEFLRPSIDEVVKRYKDKFHHKAGATEQSPSSSTCTASSSNALTPTPSTTPLPMQENL